MKCDHVCNKKFLCSVFYIVTHAFFYFLNTGFVSSLMLRNGADSSVFKN